HVTAVMPRWCTARVTSGVCRPATGSKNVGQTPSRSWNTCWARHKPWNRGSNISVDVARCERLPMRWPWAISCRSAAALLATARPEVKNVAGAPAPARARPRATAPASELTSTVRATAGVARAAWLVTGPNHDALADVAPTHTVTMLVAATVPTSTRGRRALRGGATG